jgi:hypothetical protein
MVQKMTDDAVNGLQEVDCYLGTIIMMAIEETPTTWKVPVLGGEKVDERFVVTIPAKSVEASKIEAGALNISLPMLNDLRSEIERRASGK